VTGKKATRNSKDQAQNEALFSPKGIQIAVGKALPSSTRARHPKQFVFKNNDKQGSSASRFRDDSSLIAR
jgi:hypothetical protein